MSLKDKVKEAFNAFIDNSAIEPTNMELNAPDGEYVNAEGGTIVVSDNSVSYIAPTEEAPAEEETPEEEMAAEVETTEMAAEPKEDKLNEVLAKLEALETKLSAQKPISKAPQKAQPMEKLTVNPNDSVQNQAFTHFLNQKIK
jgi:hypothetical protein